MLRFIEVLRIVLDHTRVLVTSALSVCPPNDELVVASTKCDVCAGPQYALVIRKPNLNYTYNTTYFWISASVRLITKLTSIMIVFVRADLHTDFSYYIDINIDELLSMLDFKHN
ncbi:unnamed protein product [Chrysodeixis includens]|uniref:Uncharacterized protein n=1 Tax=Chrysodeixis includens TaxID=689277 RepID=A0A9P0FP03_CHRIL|nr:unnamed protein product [Chrysodeixis includens]